MNYITTNIRFPEDMYLEIKEEALKQRKSFGAIVREKFSKKKQGSNKKTENFLKRLKKFAAENSGKFYGKSAEQIIREMRDEQ